MTSHDYMIASPYGLVVFTTSQKNVIVVISIYDYVIHDYLICIVIEIRFENLDD